MKKKFLPYCGVFFLCALWLSLALWAWLRPADSVSVSERRKLAQFPQLSSASLLNGSFMSGFESYTQDQFPGRDTFRTFKSLFCYGALGQLDKDGIYLSGGYIGKLDYPTNDASVKNAVQKFQSLYEQYLANSGSNIYLAIVPDKGYYLAQEGGYPAMDYASVMQSVSEALPWAQNVDLTGCLDISDYYRTDTHWRQKCLLTAAQELCGAMKLTPPQAQDFTRQEALSDFRGVYYGQAALPLPGEPMYLLRNDFLDGCTVLNYETGATTGIYDMDKLASRDPYEVYLSGATALLTIHTPNTTSDRELIVFRDSFGSSLIPLLLQDYSTVTVVDIRYVSSDYLGKLMDFHGQDVLFLYSTLLLNNSSTLK